VLEALAVKIIHFRVLKGILMTLHISYEEVMQIIPPQWKKLGSVFLLINIYFKITVT